MANLTAKEAALIRMAMLDETRNLQEGNNNAHPDARAEYPRMMYRKIDQEERMQQTDEHAKCGATYLVVNKYAGLLCETRVAEDADEAEALTAEGWDSSPEAAHGIQTGIAAATSAKDAEIAELRRRLEEREQPAPRRGRPPNVREEEVA